MAQAAVNRWSHAVTTRPAATFPPSKIYTQSAREIYLAMRRPSVSPNGLASAIQMVQFFINRAGRTLPEHRKRVLRRSIEYLRIELLYLKQHEKFQLEYQPPPVYPPPAKRIGGRYGVISVRVHQSITRKEKQMEISSLAEYFGVEIVPNPEPDVKGVSNLRKFALHFGAEVQLDEVNKQVRFCTDDKLFVIRCDVDDDAEGATVYQGFIKTFRPETTLAFTEYLPSIHAVLEDLQLKLEELLPDAEEEAE